jgi:tetratricopeptide (TPR) repeat protein
LITHSSGDLLRRARLRAADELEDPAARLAVYDALGSFTDDGYEGMYLDRRAAALDALGRHEEAAAERLRLLETAPSGELGAEAWLLVGEARFEAGDFVGARSAYETVMSIARPGAPRWAFANYKLAWCQWALGDRQAAVERLRAALTDLDPPIAAIAAQELKKLEAALLR